MRKNSKILNGDNQLASAIINGIKMADMEWKNIDVTNLVRHVSLQYDRKTLKKFKLLDIVPIPKSKTTFFIGRKGRCLQQPFD